MNFSQSWSRQPHIIVLCTLLLLLLEHTFPILTRLSRLSAITLCFISQDFSDPSPPASSIVQYQVGSIRSGNFLLVTCNWKKIYSSHVEIWEVGLKSKIWLNEFQYFVLERERKGVKSKQDGDTPSQCFGYLSPVCLPVLVEMWFRYFILHHWEHLEIPLSSTTRQWSCRYFVVTSPPLTRLIATNSLSDFVLLSSLK